MITNLVVVSPHKGSILVGAGLAVEAYHGDAAVVCLVYDWRQRYGRIWSNDKQIDLLLDETLNLLNLLQVIILGRGKLQSHIVMGVTANPQLVVLLVSPYILTTL